MWGKRKGVKGGEPKEEDRREEKAEIKGRDPQHHGTPAPCHVVVARADADGFSRANAATKSACDRRCRSRNVLDREGNAQQPSPSNGRRK